MVNIIRNEVEAEFYNREALGTLNEWLGYETRFAIPPEVEIVAATQSTEEKDLTVEDFGVSTARQCYYTGKGSFASRDTEADRMIATSTLEGGHHTTRMHAYFTYRLTGISRQSVWRVFHSYPYYNSEQQSQRYAQLNKGGILIPNFEDARQLNIYTNMGLEMSAYYKQLLQTTSDTARSRMMNQGIYNSMERAPKIGQEVARYVLPIGQKTNMFHTLSHLQILRLFRSGNIGSFTDEDRYVIAKMILEINNFEIGSGQINESLGQSQRSILASLEPPLTKNELHQESILADLRGHDYTRYNFGCTLVGDYSNAQALLAQSIRIGTGLEGSDEMLVGIALDPRTNPLIADMYDSGIHDPMTRALRALNVTFITKLSHAADSQRQRHRRTPGSIEPMLYSYHGPDYIIPMVVREDKNLLLQYEQMMGRIYQGYERALEAGMPVEYANLLLPNAHAVVNLESGDLFDVLHKLRQRLCFLAQEEISQIMEQQALYLRQILPQTDAVLGAPCAIRDLMGISPKCPEGSRYCGTPVWKIDLEDYYDSRAV